MGEWMKCSERLPEPSRKTLLLGWQKNYGPCLIIRRLNDWEYLDGDTCTTAITHWQAMPVPPQD